MRGISAILAYLLLGVAAITHASHPAGQGHEKPHGLVPVPSGLPAPQIGLELFEDQVSGYNLEINLRHFVLVPPVEELMVKVKELMNRKVTGSLMGHAHLYINGQKLMRLYSPYIHLPENLFVEGINVITVSLNNHQHDTWTVGQQEIQATLTINTTLTKAVLNQYSSSPTLIAGESTGN